jgi:hypothetical protein
MERGGLTLKKGGWCSQDPLELPQRGVVLLSPWRPSARSARAIKGLPRSAPARAGIKRPAMAPVSPVERILRSALPSPPSRVYETTLERLLRRFGGGADGRLAVSVCRPQGGDWRGQEGAVGGTSDERDRETKYVFPWWGTRAPSRKRCLSARSLCKTLCFRCRSDTFTVSLSNRRDTHDRRSGANERRRR